jgi:hypothetical protein
MLAEPQLPLIIKRNFGSLISLYAMHPSFFVHEDLCTNSVIIYDATPDVSWEQQVDIDMFLDGSSLISKESQCSPTFVPPISSPTFVPPISSDSSSRHLPCAYTHEAIPIDSFFLPEIEHMLHQSNLTSGRQLPVDIDSRSLPVTSVLRSLSISAPMSPSLREIPGLAVGSGILQDFNRDKRPLKVDSIETLTSAVANEINTQQNTRTSEQLEHLAFELTKPIPSVMQPQYDAISAPQRNLSPKSWVDISPSSVFTDHSPSEDYSPSSAILNNSTGSVDFDHLIPSNAAVATDVSLPRGS